MRKKIAVLLLTTAMAAASLAGCAEPDTSAPSGTPAAEANGKNTSAQEAGEGKTTIRFLSAMQLVDEEMIQAFMDANPDIEVKYEYVDSGNYSAKFAALASANELPDVFWTQSGYYCDQIKEGLLMDLSDEMASNCYEGDKAWKDTFVPNLLTNFEGLALAGCGEMESYDYGVPFTMTTVAVMYDKAIYDRLNLTEPATWEAFMENCDGVKQAGYTPLTVQSNTCVDWLPRLFWDQYCRVEIEEQGLSFADKTMTFETESVKQGMSQFKDLWDKGYLAENYFTADLDTTAQMFLQGELAQILVSPDMSAYIMDNAPDTMELATFALPGIAGLPSRSLGGSSNIFAVSAGTKEPEAAVRLVKYLTSRTNFETDDGLKYSNSGLLDIKRGEALDQLLAGYTAAADGGFCPDVFIPTTANTEINSEFKNNLLPNYLLGQIELDTVCNDLQELYDSFLED